MRVVRILNGCQKYEYAKYFPEENYFTRYRDLIYDYKLQFVSGRQKAADYVKMLNDSSLAQERSHLC